MKIVSVLFVLSILAITSECFAQGERQPVREEDATGAGTGEREPQPENGGEPTTPDSVVLTRTMIGEMLAELEETTLPQIATQYGIEYKPFKVLLEERVKIETEKSKSGGAVALNTNAAVPTDECAVMTKEGAKQESEASKARIVELQKEINSKIGQWLGNSLDDKGKAELEMKLGDLAMTRAKKAAADRCLLKFRRDEQIAILKANPNDAAKRAAALAELSAIANMEP